MSFIQDLVRNMWYTLTNPLRRLRSGGMDYVQLWLTGSFPERRAKERLPFPWSLLPWAAAGMSIETLNEQLERLAADPRVRGAILMLDGLTADLTTIRSLREAVGRFHAKGKRTVAYLTAVTTGRLYMASVAGEVALPESATLPAAGLRLEVTFVKETLSRLGIEVDIEALGEYKTAPDRFCRSSMSEAHREMENAILDGYYAEIVSAIAGGRGLAEDDVRRAVDDAPLTAQEMVARGLADVLVYEDQLATHLGTPERPAALATWREVRRRLVRPRRWRARQSIGIVSVEGTIVPGPSRRLPSPLPIPYFEEQAGAETVSQSLRRAERDNRVAAVVLHVDSPGGSALAADLIWREVLRLRRRKPVVVYMGSMAASGGYYISAPANHIVAQATTLTGSIGIWGGKVVTAGLYEKWGARREVLQRGEMAGLYSDMAPFTKAGRQKFCRLLEASYARFQARVAEGRGIEGDRVEKVARGRVWTGRQALERGLIDEVGDLWAAVEKAKQLAALDTRRQVPVVTLRAGRRRLLPLPFEGGALLGDGVLALVPWQVRVVGSG